MSIKTKAIGLKVETDTLAGHQNVFAITLTDNFQYQSVFLHASYELT
jgi:hypothetical protein